MDSPEHKTLIQYYDKLVTCVQQSPSDVMVQLRPYGMLAPADLTFLRNSSHDKNEKAIQIIEAVLSQVQGNPQQFSSFIKALRAAGPWTGATARNLERTYTTLSDQYSNYDEIDELDTSKLPAELQALELDLENLKVTFSKTESISILMAGKTGSGKSALTNGILGFKVGGEGPAQEGWALEPCTQEVTKYETRKGKIQVTVWDSPGLQDGTEKQEEYLRQMSKKCGERDLTIYCINILEIRFALGEGNPDVVVMKKLTNTFGNEFWTNTIIVLTFANILGAMVNVDKKCLSQSDQNDKDKACTRKIQEWKKQIQEILIKSIQVPDHIVRAIRIVPAGHYTEPHLLGFWLSALWMYCVDMMSIHKANKIPHKIPTLDTYEDKLAELLYVEPSKAKTISQAKEAKTVSKQLQTSTMIDKPISQAKSTSQTKPSNQATQTSSLAKPSSHEKSLNILVTGKTGSGKSTLIKGLFEVKDYLPDSPISIRRIMYLQNEITNSQTTKNNINLTVWQSARFQDGMRIDNEEEYLCQMKQECSERDLTIYCIRITDTRFVRGDDNPDVLAMKKLTRTFGDEVWSNTIIVLTLANILEVFNLEWEDLSIVEKSKAFLAVIQQWEKKIRACMIEDVKVPVEIVRAIRIVPAGHHKKSHLPGCENWLSHLWSHCYKTISTSEAQAALKAYTGDKFKDSMCTCASMRQQSVPSCFMS